jgi:DNA repair exonuclease SbcCD ATPase subunit
LKALLQVAVDDHCAVETMARYRLIEDILTIILQRRLSADDESKSILTRIEIEIKRWPQALVQQLLETLKRRIPDSEPLLKQLLRESVPSTPNHILHTNRVEQHAEEQISTAGEKTQIKSTLEQHIFSLTSQLEELRALANLLSEEERLKKELERQIQEQKVRESSLQARVETISAELEDAATRLKTASIRIEELEMAHKLTRENMEIERQRLTQQITANALGRVEEFKNNLALVLSRLIRDLPARDAHLTADVGNIVFLQFHQFLDVMDGQGVKIRKGKGAI